MDVSRLSNFEHIFSLLNKDRIDGASATNSQCENTEDCEPTVNMMIAQTGPYDPMVDYNVSDCFTSSNKEQFLEGNWILLAGTDEIWKKEFLNFRFQVESADKYAAIAWSGGWPDWIASGQSGGTSTGITFSLHLQCPKLRIVLGKCDASTSML